MLKKKIKSAVKVFKKMFPGAKYVLDVGCREGFSAQYLAKGHEVCSIDIEKKWVDHNKKKGRCCFWGNFLNYDFGHKKYDAIFSRHCIEHTGSIELFLKKCYGLLVDQGVLFLIMPLEQTVTLDLGKDDEKDMVSEEYAAFHFKKIAGDTVSGVGFTMEYFGYTKDVGITPYHNDYLFIGRKF